MQVVKPSPALIALKPRQLLLSTNSTMKSQETSSAPSLTPHQNSLLILSVAQFLQRNSFSKTLKKFLSEAQIQKNDLTGSSLDLEEMCSKYLATRESEVDDKSAKSKKIEEQVSQEAVKESATDVMGGLQSNEPAKKEKEKKKKKIKLDESHVDSVECPSEPLAGVEDKTAKEQVSQEAAKESATDVIGGLQSNEPAKKEKEKKKKKIKLDESHVDSVECPSEPLAGVEDKTKDKKKKKNKPTSDALVGNASDISLEDKTSKPKKKKKKDDSEDVEEGKSNDDENGSSKVDSTITDDKSSKKRKRLDSEVQDYQPVNENAAEDSKRRKTETTENGNIEKNGKHSEQKSSKKQQNGSAQPKKPFQRVNVEEVVFVDSRLEDNSYWAKDGAEIGYGAKAQEVLGQVRGRDFRHEKTKKKRGSYRGGQIDFSSHSVKFNYSDEE